MVVETTPKYKETLERLIEEIKTRSKDITSLAVYSKEIPALVECESCCNMTVSERFTIEVIERGDNTSTYYFHTNCYLDIMNGFIQKKTDRPDKTVWNFIFRF